MDRAPAGSAPRDPGSEPRAHSAWFLAALCVLVWASRMVLPGDLPYSDLDRSWCMGLAHALEHGWRFGVDTVFTFGPLGCLSTGLYLEHLFWIKVLVWEGAFQLLVAVVVTMAGASIETRLLRVLYFLLIVASPIDPDAYAFLAIVAVLTWIVRGRDRRVAAGIGAAVLAGLSLVKFTYSVAALACVISSTAILWRSTTRRLASAFFPGFLALTALAWRLCGQALADLPTYVARSLQLSGGYSGAMSSPAPPWTKGVAIALLASAALAVALARTTTPRSSSGAQPSFRSCSDRARSRAPRPASLARPSESWACASPIPDSSWNLAPGWPRTSQP